MIVITDGEPTAHVLADGGVFFNYPPVPETIEATLQEVVRCTRERIRINTFVLDATGGLRTFVEKMTQLNRGRAFFTTPDTLGDYVLVDFVEHRSALATRRLAPTAPEPRRDFGDCPLGETALLRSMMMTAVIIPPL